MPWHKTKLPNGKVRVSSPGGVRSRGTSEANANKQIALLRAIEHGFDPDKEKSIRKFWASRKRG